LCEKKFTPRLIFQMWPIGLFLGLVFVTFMNTNSYWNCSCVAIGIQACTVVSCSTWRKFAFTRWDFRANRECKNHIFVFWMCRD